jgi:hypothetical protein
MQREFSTAAALTPEQGLAALRRIRRPDTGARATGALLYQGPSAVDGAPIAVILTGLVKPSENSKTGPMLQTYIVRADVGAMPALMNGSDVSVCGDCPHRSRVSGGSGACYVNVGQGPRAVVDAYARGIYPQLSQGAACGVIAAAAALGIGLRVGSYGDPASVPAAGRFWRPLISAAAFHTGYTHAAHLPRGQGLRGVIMASADSAAERDRYREAGWASFRVASTDADRAPGEARCPASEEAGKRVQCARCPIGCDGAGLSVVIVAHGSTASSFSESDRGEVIEND